MSRRRRTRGRTRAGRRAVVLAVAGLLALAAAAYAAVVNPSFEDGLNGWTAEIVPEGSDQAVPATCGGISGNPQRGVCVIDGSDTFTPTGGSPVTVTPLDGNRMVRLGGPFLDDDQTQFQDRYRLRQTFTVDPANPILSVNFNVFLFDYQGFDTLNFTVSVTDANGDPISGLTQGGFGNQDDTTLKTTGWRTASIDLTGFDGQQVHLLIDAGGTHDNLFGFWAYIDGGPVQTRPVEPPSFSVPTNPVTGQPVPFNTYADPLSGQVFIAIPNAQTSDFEDGCVGPIPISVPIAAGGGTVSEVFLVGTGEQIPMTEGPPGVWNAEIPCADDFDLAVQYKLTEGTESETFIVPIGGIALIDPAGVVYDVPRFTALKAAGQSDEQARNGAAIEGATVRLQRKSPTGEFRNVLSGDPGISPNINPEVTGANGQFQWLVDPGVYRVVVTKAGYPNTTSREVEIPPEVTDLHVGLGTAPPPPPPPPPPAVTPPPPPAPPKKACASLTGKRLAACRRAEALKKATAACKTKHKGKKNAKKRALCIKRAKALSKCSAITGKKNAKKKQRCVAKARKIGAKPKRTR